MEHFRVEIEETYEEEQAVRERRMLATLALLHTLIVSLASAYHFFVMPGLRKDIVKGFASPYMTALEFNFLQYIGNVENGLFAGLLLFPVDMLLSRIERLCKDHEAVLRLAQIARKGAPIVLSILFILINIDVETTQLIPIPDSGTPLIADIPAGVYGYVALAAAFLVYKRYWSNQSAEG